MEHRISLTRLARRLRNALWPIRPHGTCVAERNGDPVARLLLPPKRPVVSLGEALDAWRSAGAPETAFADDLQRIGTADRPPENPLTS